jgi:phage FluMu protein gp41
MKTFQEYVQLQELTGYKLGTELMGKSSLDSDMEQALSGAMQAFEVILYKRSSAAIQFLNRMSQSVPEIQGILTRHNLDSFKDKDFARDAKFAARKGSKIIARGLGNVSPEDVASHNDVVVGSGADSYHNPIG